MSPICHKSWVLFCEPPLDRIWFWSEEGCKVYRHPSRGANCLAVAGDGSLIASETTVITSTPPYGKPQAVYRGGSMKSVACTADTVLAIEQHSQRLLTISLSGSPPLVFKRLTNPVATAFCHPRESYAVLDAAESAEIHLFGRGGATSKLALELPANGLSGLAALPEQRWLISQETSLHCVGGDGKVDDLLQTVEPITGLCVDEIVQKLYITTETSLYRAGFSHD